MTHVNLELNDGSILLLNDESELTLNEIGAEHPSGGGTKNRIRFGPRQINIIKYKQIVKLSIPIYGALASEYSNLLRGQLFYEKKVNAKSQITVDESFRISSKITSNHIIEAKSRLESNQSAIIGGLISRKFLKMNKAVKLLGLMELYDD